MSVMMVQAKLPQTVPYPEQRNWKKKYHEGTTELENWQSEISPEY